jgi:PHD/YefM family antitoxin component YafN of YafNO toxin-antitoxin module
MILPASRLSGTIDADEGDNMLTVHPEIVIGRNRKPRAVLLPYSEWNRILADMEELDDIRAYDRAKAHGDDVITFEQAVKELRKKRSL